MNRKPARKARYGEVKTLLASLTDPLSCTMPEFSRKHRLNFNSVSHAARRLGMRFKDQKVVKPKQEVVS